MPQNVAGWSTITVTSINGFNGTLNLAVSAIPTSGLGCSLSTYTITLSISQPSTLSMWCGGAVGVYTVYVSGASYTLSHYITLSVTVTDFGMQATTRLNLGNGTSGSVGVSLYSSAGFSATVNVAASLPQNCTATTCPSVTPSTSSVYLGPSSSAGISFSISAPSTIAFSGTYTVTFTGTSPGLSHSVATTVSVCVTRTDPSLNWAGYVLSSDCNKRVPIYRVSAYWHVPSASEPAWDVCDSTFTNNDCKVSPWIGLMPTSGVGDIVQVATQSIVHCAWGSCSTSYRAVWEFYPANDPVDTGITVHSGDLMFAQVTNNALNGGLATQYTLEIDDKTTNANWVQIHSWAEFTQSNGQPYPDMGAPMYAGFITEWNIHLPYFTQFSFSSMVLTDKNSAGIGGLDAYNAGWWRLSNMCSGNPCTGNNQNVAVSTIINDSPLLTLGLGQFTVTYVRYNGT